MEIHEGGGHFSPVAELEGALAEAAAGDDGDGVGGAAIDFNEGDEALAICAPGIVDSKAFKAEHGHTDAEDLAGAEVSVSDLGFVEKFVQKGGIGPFYDHNPPQAVYAMARGGDMRFGAGFVHGPSTFFLWWWAERRMAPDVRFSESTFERVEVVRSHISEARCGAPKLLPDLVAGRGLRLR